MTSAHALFTSPMRIVLLALGIAAGGCGGETDICTQARQHVQACAADVELEEDFTCTDDRADQARQLISLDCQQIEDLLAGLGGAEAREHLAELRRGRTADLEREVANLGQQLEQAAGAAADLKELKDQVHEQLEAAKAELAQANEDLADALAAADAEPGELTESELAEPTEAQRAVLAAEAEIDKHSIQDLAGMLEAAGRVQLASGARIIAKRVEEKGTALDRARYLAGRGENEKAEQAYLAAWKERRGLDVIGAHAHHRRYHQSWHRH